MPCAEMTFDLVVALSVFTHMTEPLQVCWMRELRRVLQPRGLLLLTVLGDNRERCSTHPL